MGNSRLPQVAVVILCWNNRDLLEECIQSVLEQTYAHLRVILVDNGSTDGSVEYVREHFPEEVVIIETGANLGFAIGNNIGIRKAFEDSGCEYVMLLNTDAIIDADWIEKMVAFARRHPKLASAQGLTVDYYDHKVIDSCGILVDRQGIATQMGYREKNVRLATRQVFGVNAAAALFSRAFLEAQPFGDDYLDSDLWMYLEDVDIGARALMMGWENWFVNDPRAYHMGSASSGKNPGFSYYMTYRNNASVLVKNLPWRVIIRMLPGLLNAELTRINYLFRGGRFALIRAMVKGRLVSLGRMHVFIRKRRRLKKYWAISQQDLWEYMELPKLKKLPPEELPYGSEVVSVIVLSRNNMGRLESCLEALVAEKYAKKNIIVVDNDSTDGSQEYVRNKYPEIILLEQKSNLGIANGFNVGLTRALLENPDYFAFVQANTEVDCGWIATMVRTMRDRPKAFAIASKIYAQTDAEAPRESVINQGYTYHPRKGAAPVTYVGNQVKPVLAASDLASMFRSETLGMIGLMDGDFFCGLEDVDFCFRAQLAGFPVYSQPAAVAHSAILPDLSVGAQWYQQQKNLFYIYVKNLPLEAFWKYMPAGLAFTVESYASAFRRGFATQQIKALVKCFLRLPRMLGHRRQVNRIRRASPSMTSRLWEEL